LGLWAAYRYSTFVWAIATTPHAYAHTQRFVAGYPLYPAAIHQQNYYDANCYLIYIFLNDVLMSKPFEIIFSLFV
jgi:hypothetical protein